MTRRVFSILLIAALTALMLIGCGKSDPLAMVSSNEEGIQTFGVAVDPAAQPSNPGTVPGAPNVVMPGVDDTVTQTDTGEAAPAVSSGNATTTANNAAGTGNGSGTGSGTGTGTGTTTNKPGSGSGSTPSVSTSPSAPTPIAPSDATAAQVRSYIGKELSEFITDHGYPISSDYEFIDEDDPDQGEIGTLEFRGFTVNTLRTNDGETITDVVEDPI